MQNKDRRKIESILSEPLTRHRFILNGKLRAAQDAEKPQPFTLEDLKEFCNGIKSEDVAFKQEVLNVLEAVQTGKAPQAPSFDTPEKQLAWGAGIAFLKLNPDIVTKTWNPPVQTGLLSESGLWKQVTETRMAYQELLSHAHHVREALRDKDTKYGWGEPGSGFAYNRQKNIIDIDLMQTMIVGFEHARADVYREIGHALLSVSYPKRMQQVYREMQPLLRKANAAANKKGPELKPDEYKQLRMLSAEWQLRHMMFNAAEENVANRFVSNMGEQVLQDYSVSLNNTAVTHRAIGLTRLPPPKNASEELRRYMNLCNAVQLSFFQNNALFENTDNGWGRVGVDTNMVRKTATLAKRPDDAKDDTDGLKHEDFAYLRELCGGTKGLENLQPKQHERLYGWSNLTGRVNHADQQRKEILEEIWRLYGEDLIQKILTQALEQVEEQLKKAQENKKDGQKQGGDEQEGEGQEGEGQEGEGQPGQGKPGKGKPSKGQKGRGQQQGEPGEMDENGEPSEGEGEPQEGEGEPGEGKPEGELGTDKDNNVPVEGAGDMPNVDESFEQPSDEVDPSAGQEGEGQDGEGEDADGDAKSMEDLEKEAEKQEGQEGEGQEGEEGQEADGEGEGEGQKPGKGKGKGNGKGNGAGQGAGQGDGKPLGELAKQDWSNYPARIAELSGPINRVRKIFQEVQKRQLQRKVSMSRSLDILPENGEVKERFNAEAHRNLTIKKLTGSLEKDDLKRFHTDENKFVPTELDIVIMIDGSGSMDSAMSNKASPLQSALQASAILYEAAAGKDMHMNVYVGMWGDSKPPIIIKPGDDRIKIGQAMEAARKGLNSGTDFAPAVTKVAETIGEQRGKSGTLSGFTHVLILSDGDIFDAEKSKEKIKTMFEYSDKVTFDVAVIKSGKNSSIERMAKDMTARKPHQEVGVVLGSDPNEVPMAIVGLLLDKVRKCGSFVAVPNSQKRRAMKKAHNKMGPKR